MAKTLIRTCTYLIVFAFGFAAGIYALPILTAPDGPSQLELANHA